YGAPLIGQLIEWPLQQMPHEIWTDMGQEYIPYMAQSFDPVKYPLLSQLHPTNVLPADMRGYVARGWDNGRGIDTGRVLMSEQGDAIRDITGSFYGRTDSAGPATGAFTNGTPSQTMGNTASLGIGPIYFKASNVVDTAAENRSKNVAWNFIVRAK
ncbi:TPA: phage tail protein, partial [Escherichia coli]